jgi:hypothetical protein
VTGPYEAGETARVHQIAHELFAENLSRVANLFLAHPNLQATSVTIENGRVDIVADGIHGVLKEWTHAIRPDRTDIALWSSSMGLGLEDVLHAGHTTVHVRRPLSKPGGGER